MKRLLIKNIKTLFQIEETPRSWVAGKDMAELPQLDDAYLAVEGDKIVDFGPMYELHGVTDWNNLDILDADGKFVLPAWCDSHTHLVFAKSREAEFVDRIRGLSYQEIAQRGGGILNSARVLQEVPEEVLIRDAHLRLEEISRQGTGAVEIKSGYGLTPEAELKMLRVIQELKQTSPLTIKATFLGAHAYPTPFREDHEGYLRQLIEEMLPQIAEEQLADYVDVFCETNYFSVEETERILEAAATYGLRPKIHVNQFTNIGGIQAGIRHNALSVDHLEVIGAEEIEALNGTRTIPVSLPSCSFFLGIPYTPVRELIDAGLPVALATDFNPGSTPSGSIPFVISLACIRQKLLPEEAIHAVTLNGAYAMGLSETHGSIAIGKKANLVITNEIPSLAYLPYAFGEQHIDTVVLNGEVRD